MYHAPAHQIDNRNDQHARPVRIFVYEHITGGGCAGDPLPVALLPEAAMMLSALGADLRAIAGLELSGLRDARVAAAARDWDERVVERPAAWQAGFDALVRASDAVWLIAPETDRVLERLSARVLDARKTLLGSAPRAIAVAASKLATARALRLADIAVVPTQRVSEAEIRGPCVAKPDDGCGCEQTRKFPSLLAADAWIRAQSTPARYVVQPYLAGEALSLSVIATPAGAVLLSVNRQRVELRDDAFSFAGCEVNVSVEGVDELARLAARAVAAIPGLWGYVGIDFLLTESGPVVLEVNPRLTTSYAGLHAAIGVNPAQLVLELLAGRAPVAPLLGRRAVMVDLRQKL
jgi:predicted ATP-grasp superfamily ATP-dependent carboligase